MTIQLFRHRFSKIDPVVLDCSDSEDMTKQSFAADCDINTLMSRYQSTGELPRMDESAPQYLDVTGMDFQEHMNIVAGAQTIFNNLPSALRERFNNDPASFLDFTSRESNRAEMADLGLLSDAAIERMKIPEPKAHHPDIPSDD